DAEAREIVDRALGKHIVADLADHHDGSAELGRRHRLVGALAAETHLEARRLERLANDRHARRIGDQVDHVAADHADPRTSHLRFLHVGGRQASGAVLAAAGAVKPGAFESYAFLEIWWQGPACLSAQP